MTSETSSNNKSSKTTVVSTSSTGHHSPSSSTSSSSYSTGPRDRKLEYGILGLTLAFLVLLVAFNVRSYFGSTTEHIANATIAGAAAKVEHMIHKHVHPHEHVTAQKTTSLPHRVGMENPSTVRAQA